MKFFFIVLALLGTLALSIFRDAVASEFDNLGPKDVIAGGIDVEYITIDQCAADLDRATLDANGMPTGPKVKGYCPELEKLALSGTKWVRYLILWRWDEPNPPTGWNADPREQRTDRSGTPGQLSGKHTYSWSTSAEEASGCVDNLMNTSGATRKEALIACSRSHMDYLVNYAEALGMSVYITVNWPPQWANRANCLNEANCAPILGGGINVSVGNVVEDPDDVRDLFHNLVTHFNVERERSGFKPVEYFGVWNEPNFRSNFNPTSINYPNAPKGVDNDTNFLQIFVDHYLRPARDGMNTANFEAITKAKLVAADLSDHCGVPKNKDHDDNCWFDDWAKPLLTQYGNLYDVFSFHRYDGDHNGVKDAADKLGSLLVKDPRDPGSARTEFWKPVWMTEGGGWKLSKMSPRDLATNFWWLHIDRINRRHFWQMTFYNAFKDGPQQKDVADSQPCKASGILCNDLTAKPTFRLQEYFTGAKPAPSSTWWDGLKADQPSTWK